MCRIPPPPPHQLFQDLRDFRGWRRLLRGIMPSLSKHPGAAPDSNTIILAPLPNAGMNVHRSAKAEHMLAIIAQAELDNYLGQSMQKHSSCASTANNEVDEYIP